MNEYLKNLQRIEVVETLACTGRCKHCSEGNHTGFTEHLDGKRGAETVAEICEIYNIDSLMVFGGEPLLYPDDVCEIIQAGATAGIRQKDIITNGYFSKDKGRIREVAEKLAESKVDYILLSVDAFHQETIPVEPVMYFANCARDAGIKTELSAAWLVSENDDNPYNIKTKEILKSFTAFGFGIAGGNIIWPEGNARIYLKDYFDETKEYKNPYADDPFDVKSISIEPNGNILQGNIYQNSMQEILENYRP